MSPPEQEQILKSGLGQVMQRHPGNVSPIATDDLGGFVRSWF